MNRYSTYGSAETVTEEVHNGHTIADLLRELREETTTLAKQEIALAKAEMKEKTSKLTRNAAYLAVGGLIAYAGLIFLFFAAMRGLSRALINNGFSIETVAWLSPLIIGLAVLIIGMILVMKAKSAFSKESLMPKKTIQSLKEDTSWTKAKLREA